MNDLIYNARLILLDSFCFYIIYFLLLLLGQKKDKQLIAQVNVQPKQYTMLVSRADIGIKLAEALLLLAIPAIPHQLGVTGIVVFLACAGFFWPLGTGLLIHSIRRWKWWVEVNDTILRIKTPFKKEGQIASVDDIIKVVELGGVEGYSRKLKYNVYFKNNDILKLHYTVIGRDLFLKEMEARGKIIRYKP